MGKVIKAAGLLAVRFLSADSMSDRFKEELGYAKELKFAELVEQIRECEEKRIASEKEAKGRDDKKGKCASSQKHVGPFDIKIVDQYLTKCSTPLITT